MPTVGYPIPDDNPETILQYNDIDPSFDLRQWAHEHADGPTEVTPQGSDLHVGTEIEYPKVYSSGGSTTWTEPGRYSGDVQSGMQSDYGGRRSYPSGTIDGDPTAGLELTSRASFDTYGLFQWYRGAIADVHNNYAEFEPCGVSGNSDSASTFGLHIHISPLSRDEAQQLYDLSCEPWFRTFVCSSVVNSTDPQQQQVDTYQVFRRSYCGMSLDDSTRRSNNCVTKHDELMTEEGDHWEWRIVEPMTPEHFGLVMRFLEILKQEGGEAAAEYARTFVEGGCPALTAIRRAEACGLIENVEEDGIEWTVSRTPYEGNEASGEFFEAAWQHQFGPYIYRVDRNDDAFYVFVSDNLNDVEDGPYERAGVMYDTSTAINAETLEPVDDDELTEELIQRAEAEIENIDLNEDEPRKTEETEVLEASLQE